MRTAVLLCACAVLLAVQSLHAYTYLQVNQPQTGRWGSGTIEEATVAMRPNGAFMKYDVTMTFSARGQQAFAQTDSLEVSYQFSLPTDAVVNDLYLWVGNEISRGLILDRATASATYEGIVKRRRDPAFLQKTSQTQYQLQIYPMAATGTRTVRFTCLVPINRSGGQWYAAVPRDLFTTSAVPLQSLRIIYYAPSQSFMPRFLNNPSLSFTSWTDTTLQANAWKCDISNEVFSSTDVLTTVPANNWDDFLVTRYAGEGSSGAYHMTFDPFSMLGIGTGRRLLVAFDYDSMKTTMTRAMYVDAVKAMLRTNCSVKDSFNVVFNSWQRAGEKWFAADSSGIQSAFSQLGAQTIPNSSDIPGLFMNIIEFLNMRGPAAGIILMAASDKLNAPAAADPVLNWLNVKLPKGIPVHVVNLMNRNYVYETYKVSGSMRYSSANLYFYDALKAMTLGTTRVPNYDGTLTTQWTEIMRLMRGGLTSLDVQVYFENGFTYSKYSYGSTPFQTVYPGQMCGQIGKVLGTGPVSFDVSAFYDGRLYHKKFLVADAQIQPADSSLRSVWAAKYISDIEWSVSQYTNPDLVKAVTDACIAERVVCRYTALLALEPGDTIRYAKNNNTGPVLTDVERGKSAVQTYEIASAYPNPFNPSTTLRVHLPEGVRPQTVTLAIYNLLGQKVKTFDASTLNASGATEFRWDGTDDSGRRTASGMYLFVVTAPGVRHTVKLMLLK
ncbi:MAG: VIT domain-containing protein [Acidobacteriota bacterium]